MIGFCNLILDARYVTILLPWKCETNSLKFQSLARNATYLTYVTKMYRLSSEFHTSEKNSFLGANKKIYEAYQVASECQ